MEKGRKGKREGGEKGEGTGTESVGLGWCRDLTFCSGYGDSRGCVCEIAEEDSGGRARSYMRYKEEVGRGTSIRASYQEEECTDDVRN